MENCKPVNTPMECEVKLSKFDEGKKVNQTLFKQLIGSLQYLTCTNPDILFGVGIISQFMEVPTMAYWNAAKRILHYIKGILDYGLFYYPCDDFKLVGYCDSD